MLRGAVILAAALVGFRYYKNREIEIAKATRTDKSVLLEDVWTDEQINVVKDQMRRRGLFKSSNNIDNVATVDHIGEATPLNKDGKCDHLMMVPNGARTHCTLAGRIDVARNHVITGGISSSKRFTEDLSTAISSIFFQQYFWDDPNNLGMDEHKPDDEFLNTLFNADKFQAATEKFCPPPNIAIRETLSITTHLPGQETPMHYDSPYFLKISRRTCPVWLLVALKHSGVWEDEEVHQIQGVAYIHGNRSHPGVEGGGFSFYPHGPKGEKYTFEAEYNHAIVVDGTYTPHAVEPYKINSKPLLGDKSSVKELRYAGNTDWNIYENGNFRMQVNEEDLRMGVVWREVCLPDKATHAKWVNERETLNATHVVAALVEKLESEGYNIPADPVDLAELIIKRFIVYPIGDGYIPYNYCALPEVVPVAMKEFTKLILRPVCRPHYDN